jgi:hypothetical protein
MFKGTGGKLFFNGQKLFTDKNFINVFDANLNISKWQLGRFASLFNALDKTTAAGKITELVNLTNNVLSKFKSQPYYIINGFSLSTAFNALYPILTSAPFMDKKNPENNFVNDWLAAALSMGLPYALYLFAPKIARPFIERHGASRAWNRSLNLAIGSVGIGAAGYSYEYFLKGKDDQDKSWFLGSLWVSAILAGGSGMYGKAAVEKLSSMAKLPNSFQTQRLLAKNINSLLMWIPPALGTGVAAVFGKDKELSNHGLGISYGTLTLGTGALIWFTKKRFKFKPNIGILEKGKDLIKPPLPMEVKLQMTALFLYTGFEGVALYKTSNAYIQDRIGFSDRKEGDYIKQILGLSGALILNLVPAFTRRFTRGFVDSPERLNRMLSHSMLSSITGTALLYSDNPYLRGAGIALIGRGTSNTFTGMKQKMKNTVIDKKFNEDIENIILGKIDHNITIVNSALGIVPVASGIIVTDYMNRNNTDKTEAGIKTLWFPASLLAGGGVIMNYKKFSILPKVLPLGYVGYKLYDGSLFTDFNRAPVGIEPFDYKMPNFRLMPDFRLP